MAFVALCWCLPAAISFAGAAIGVFAVTETGVGILGAAPVF